jgi:hypothetical protein
MAPILVLRWPGGAGNAKTELLGTVRPGRFIWPVHPPPNIRAWGADRDFGVADPHLQRGSPFPDPGDPGSRSAPRRIEGAGSCLQRATYPTDCCRSVDRHKSMWRIVAVRARRLAASIQYLDCRLAPLDVSNHARERIPIIDDPPHDRFGLRRIAGDQQTA